MKAWDKAINLIIIESPGFDVTLADLWLLNLVFLAPASSQPFTAHLHVVLFIGS